MKHLKYFEKRVEFLSVGDIVMLIKAIKAKPNYKVGDFFEIISTDRTDRALPYEIVPVRTPTEDIFKYAIWAKYDEVKKASDIEIDQNKYNL